MILLSHFIDAMIIYHVTTAVAQSVRAFNLHATGWMFESQPQPTEVVKTGGDISTAKPSATSVCVTGPRKLTL